MNRFHEFVVFSGDSSDMLYLKHAKCGAMVWSSYGDALGETSLDELTGQVAKHKCPEPED